MPMSSKLVSTFFTFRVRVSSLIEALDPFELSFVQGDICGSICIFYKQSSNLTNPIYLKKPSFIQCVFWLLCQKSGVHKCVELCLSLQLNSTKQCAGFYGNIIVQLETGNGDTSRSYVPDIFLNFCLQCLKVFYIQMFYLFC